MSIELQNDRQNGSQNGAIKAEKEGINKTKLTPKYSFDLFLTPPASHYTLTIMSLKLYGVNATRIILVFVVLIVISDHFESLSINASRFSYHSV